MIEHALEAGVKLRAWRDHEGSAAFVEVLEPEEVDAFHGSWSRPFELCLRTLIEPLSHDVCCAGRAGHLTSEPIEAHLLLVQHLQLVFLIGVRFELDRDARALRAFGFDMTAQYEAGSSGHQLLVGSAEIGLTAAIALCRWRDRAGQAQDVCSSSLYASIRFNVLRKAAERAA